MEGDEEDNPPLLVGVEEDEAQEEGLNIKVPITIVTGKSFLNHRLLLPNCKQDILGPGRLH